MSISKVKNAPRRISDTLLIEIFPSNHPHGQTLTGLNGQFCHSQILLDVLLRLRTTREDRNELMRFCEKELKNNQAELNILDEFEENYSSHRALWWYTRETFIYRFLNRALRFQDIDLLFLFRFFIFDIQKQLEANQCLHPIRVYRGQLMSNEELVILQNSIGQFLSIKSFLSTSIHVEEALSFLDAFISRKKDLQHVLIIIDADPNIPGIKPFANIAANSFYPGEEEVLFMLGSIFRIEKSHYSVKEQIWMIHMILCSDFDQKLQAIFHWMKNEYGNGQTGLLTFSRILRQMGKFNEAERYYQRFLNQHEHDYHSQAQCYHLLGNLACDQGNYDLSLEYQMKSLEIKLNKLPMGDVSLAYSYNSLGIVHWKKGYRQEALDSYAKALQIWLATSRDDDLKVAVCLNNMGIVYDDEKKYFEALQCYEQTLNIRLKHLPDEHYHIGEIYNNIGAVHRCLGQNDLAIDYFNRALDIYRKSLISPHPSIASTYKNLGITYAIKNNRIQALEFYQKAAAIFQQILPFKHPDNIEINRLICHVIRTD